MFKMIRRVILAFFMLVLCTLCFLFYQTKKQSDALVLEVVPMQDVQDGSYEGECTTGLVSVRLRILVKQHIIQDIQLLKHENGRGQQAESIVKEIQKSNGLDVDDVSGATISSRAIKMAAQKALQKGISISKTTDA